MKYGFIGCGNMGGAIARGLRAATDDFIISDRSGKAAILAAELEVEYGDNETIARSCDRIFLAVKPHMVPEVIAPLQEILAERKPIIISMAAGLEIKRLNELLGGDARIIRIMPNTPVTVGMGMTEYCHNDQVTAAELDDFLEDMRFCGMLDPLEERLFDAASALSGCGPAYAYMFLEALADGAVACGLPRAKAYEYAAATMAGAARMVIATDQHPGVLKDAVCSPGGSTIAGVRALERHGFRGAVMDCVIAAWEKNQKLGK